MKNYLLRPVRFYGLGLSLVGAVLILLAAFAYEQLTGLLPCPLCWLQRGIFGGFAVLSLLSLLMLRSKWLSLGAVFLWLVALVAGVGVAARHLYIKMNPASASCGLDIDTLLDFFPLLTVLQEVLKGSADCAQAADLLLLPLPVWSLAGYVILASCALVHLITRLKFVDI